LDVGSAAHASTGCSPQYGERALGKRKTHREQAMGNKCSVVYAQIRVYMGYSQSVGLRRGQPGYEII